MKLLTERRIFGLTPVLVCDDCKRVITMGKDGLIVKSCNVCGNRNLKLRIFNEMLHQFEPVNMNSKIIVKEKMTPIIECANCGKMLPKEYKNVNTYCPYCGSYGRMIIRVYDESKNRLLDQWDGIPDEVKGT